MTRGTTQIRSTHCALLLVWLGSDLGTARGRPSLSFTGVPAKSKISGGGLRGSLYGPAAVLPVSVCAWL